MTNDLLIGYIAALMSIIVGFILNEIHDWYKESKKANKKQRDIAQILFFDSNGIVQSMDSFTHECHRPEYDEYLEMVCIAKNARGEFFKNILKDLQTICNDPTLFENPISVQIFNLKIFLSDFIDRCHEVNEFDDFWTSELKRLGVTNLDDISDQDLKYRLNASWYYRFEDLHERFVRDFNSVYDKNIELRDFLRTKYNLIDTQE